MITFILTRLKIFTNVRSVNACVDIRCAAAFIARIRQAAKASFGTPLSLCRTELLLFMALLGVLFHGANLSVRAAQPPNEAAVARFVKQGVFDLQQITENDLYARLKAAYARERDPQKLRQLGDRLLQVKWMRLWEADKEMPPETELVSYPLPRYFHPSFSWQWTRIPGKHGAYYHYSQPAHGIARHQARGTFPALLPANGSLLQEVYFPDGQIPQQILLRIETRYLGNPKQRQSVVVQAKWTKEPEQHFNTENRPQNFWAGAIGSNAPRHKQTLQVNLVDLGLCGRNRSIHGIEYLVVGGRAWFGRTLIRRPQVEIQGTAPYHIYAVDDRLTFDLKVHNFASTDQQYTLDVKVLDYQGRIIRHKKFPCAISGRKHWQKRIAIAAGKSRYWVIEYTLSQGEQILDHGFRAATMIVPNTTGRDPQTRFGMMYWDQPGSDMVTLYERLGVKLAVIFPELERLHLFDPEKFEIMPMFWSFPHSKTRDAAQLARKILPYFNAGQRIFSNFWETDLRVPAAMFAPEMRRFSEIIKQQEPAALTGIGGLAWFNIAYLNQLLTFAKTDPPSFDFLALMLYNTPSPPEYSGIIQETAALQTLLQQAGVPQIELWNVEWSYFDTLNLDGGLWLNTSVARDRIAPYTIRHHLLGFAAGITRMIPGTNVFTGRPPLAKNYGHSMTLGRSSVTRYDLTPLPLLPAYSTLTRMLEGKTFVSDNSLDSTVFCHRYEAVNKRYQALSSAKSLLVTWSPSGTKNITLRFPQSPEFELTVVNMIGEPSSHRVHHGELVLSISPEPLYVLLPEDHASQPVSPTIENQTPLLSVMPTTLDIIPGNTSTVSITYTLFNPGDHPLQGNLRLLLPDWLQTQGITLRSEGKSDRQVTPGGAVIPIRLQEGEQVQVICDMRLSETFPHRQTYYEQSAVTRQSSYPLNVELIKNSRIVAQATTTAHILPPLNVRMRPRLASRDGTSAKIEVDVTNRSSISREGRIRMIGHGQTRVKPMAAEFYLSPGQRQTYEFTLTGASDQPQTYLFETVDTRLRRIDRQISLQPNQAIPLHHYQEKFGYLSSFGIGEGYVVEALVRDQQGYETRQSRGMAFRPAVKASAPITIDGQLHDWADADPLFVRPEGRLSGLTFFAKDYGAEMQWSGQEDFASAWQMMWDQTALYLAVKVFDDQVMPQHNLGSFWDGDTFSFQIDPHPDAADASMLPSQPHPERLQTFDVGLSRQGPKIRRKYPTEGHAAGPVLHIRLATRREADGLLYELAIPWEELSPLRPEAGTWFGFSLVFSEDDGMGRETQSNWFGGSGGNGLARVPRLMGDVHLVE